MEVIMSEPTQRQLIIDRRTALLDRRSELADAEKKGWDEGQNMMGNLMTRLFSQGRVSDAQKAAADPAYREKLYREFQMA